MLGKTLLVFLASFIVQAKLPMAKSKSILSLNPASFESATKSRIFLVEFYVPECPSCSRLYLVLTTLVVIVEDRSINDIAIGAIDCRKHEKFCISKNVTSYPSLALFEKGGSQHELFNGPVDLYTLIKLLRLQNIPVDREYRAETICVPGSVFKLSSDTFHATIANGIYFIKFFSSTCHYCTALAPVWTELAQGMTDNTLCIAEYDCESERSICNELNIKSVPTMLWFQNGRVVQKFKGGRDIDNLRTFVGQMLNGTYKAAAAAALATVTIDKANTLMCTFVVFAYIYIT
ncbi:thioredoxin domain-containing protein 5 [Drosophila montana]|uniref:thioredoxin domain-containing protein 5 n=1 Tax=Drosophila montana TaxID=40370 RepID=UPI00313D58B8